MEKSFKHLIAVVSALVLTACGGGGGGSSGTGSSNPLAKYVGTYSACNQDNRQIRLVISVSGEKSLFIKSIENIFDTPNCTGSPAGTFTSEPFLVTYTSSGVVTATGPDLPSASIEIDKLSFDPSTYTEVASGPGAKGDCITYSGGQEICTVKSVPSALAEGGLYLSNSTLYLVVSENGVYTAGIGLKRL